MLLFTFLIGFVLSASAWADYQPPSYCETETKRVAVTNTWGRAELAEITSTEVVHDHTAIRITNTKFIPTTTVSTLTVTHLQQVPHETTVLTISQTYIRPKTETRTHTNILTRTTQIHHTETEVNYMTLTKTVLKPTTTTRTSERLVTSYVPNPYVDATTVTHWETSTTEKPVIITWDNFRTSTVLQTVFITKAHAKPAHSYTTVTEFDTVTKCHGRPY